ncbi:hypothetical protein F511_28668 [Dorcoceras hygrometricum]|uniref:Uncharacterized protein n=1 Tax=Dorcoceras hygrometricum TaxID=472368 RepID=A0A2Z7AGS0_9LAMI|nr:hypothetical protein F511_28668 [Dorcoceras hygrometricum]
MSFVKASVIYDCCESMKYDDPNSSKLNQERKAGIVFSKPENSKPRWLKNKLGKDKAKAGRKPFVPNQSCRSSTKVKSGWKKVQQKRDLNGQNTRLLRHPALEGVTRSARTDSPRRIGRRQFSGEEGGGAHGGDGGGLREETGRRRVELRVRVFERLVKSRETVELICGDVDFIVQLRNQVMKYVVDFFHSFSLNKLSDLASLRDLKEKEKLILSWAETDFLETAVKRQMYILAKCREMLLRKFLDSHRKYFTPGQPWTAMASHIIDLLSVAHSKSLEDLLAQQKEHGIITDRPSSSQLFKDLDDNSVAVLAQFYSMSKSSCWVRPMILIDGTWTPLQGNDYWNSNYRLSLFVNRKLLPESVVEENFVPHVFFIEPVQYWGATPSLIKSWGWARVCTEVVRYSMFGCLRPVRDENLCRDIVAISSVVDVFEKLPTGFCSVVQQGEAANNFVGYFSHSDVQSIAEDDLVSSDGSIVYRSPSPQLDCFQYFNEAESEQPSVHIESSSMPSISVSDPVIQIDFVQLPDFPTHTDSPMRFNADDISLDATPDNQILLPVGPIEFSAALDDLQTFISQRIDDSNNEILSKIHTLERSFRDALLQQEEAIRNSIQSARQDNHAQGDVQLVHINEFKKSVLAHSVSVITDLMDVKKEVKVVENLLTLSTQLGDLVDYIRGGDAKKGEGSSRSPQPPPDDQGGSSGGRGTGDNTRNTYEAVMPKRGKEVAEAPNHLLMIKVEAVEAEELVIILVKLILWIDFPVVCTEKAVVGAELEEVVLDIQRKDILAVLVD